MEHNGSSGRTGSRQVLQYSSALLQESGVPAPLLLNACAERADLIDELQQLLMQCRLGAQHFSIV